LVALKAKKQRNAMHGFTAVNCALKSLKEENDSLNITVYLRVTCYDYLVSTTNNSVVRGNKNKLNDYTYRLSFLVSKDSKMLTNCPNCNAKLKGRGATVKCEYCGSTINRKSSTMVLERKEMVEQR
jgi:hypothetical protein